MQMCGSEKEDLIPVWAENKQGENSRNDQSQTNQNTDALIIKKKCPYVTEEVAGSPTIDESRE